MSSTFHPLADLIASEAAQRPVDATPAFYRALQGIRIRDDFAMAFIRQTLPTMTVDHLEDASRNAYLFADAMMIARGRK